MQVSASFDITTTVPNMVFSCSEYTGTISPEQVYKIKVSSNRLGKVTIVTVVIGDVPASVGWLL